MKHIGRYIYLTLILSALILFAQSPNAYAESESMEDCCPDFILHVDYKLKKEKGTLVSAADLKKQCNIANPFLQIVAESRCRNASQEIKELKEDREQCLDDNDEKCVGRIDKLIHYMEKENDGPIGCEEIPCEGTILQIDPVCKPGDAELISATPGYIGYNTFGEMYIECDLVIKCECDCVGTGFDESSMGVE